MPFQEAAQDSTVRAPCPMQSAFVARSRNEAPLALLCSSSSMLAVSYKVHTWMHPHCPYVPIILKDGVSCRGLGQLVRRSIAARDQMEISAH